GASRGGAYVAQPAVKQTEGLAQPVGDANIGAQGGAAERIPFDLIDRELAAEAPRDAIHELGDDLLTVLLLGPADECGVSRDVGHDEQTFHRRDGTSAVGARMSWLGALEAETEARATAAIDRTLERDRAAMGFGDVLHDRKTKARTRQLPCVVRSPEAVEHPGRVLDGDARTVIAHGDLAVRDGHLNGCTRRAVLRGVVEQIGNRPGDADLHAVDRGRRSGHVEAHLRIAERHVVDDLVHDLVELQLLERHRRFLVASDLDQIANEGRETLDLTY